ncbi:ATP-binding protein [Metabacillus idriensis]|uniref:ATP-binding protein n=1 Tax=Metabacillus idriensis TaxID=324768 RepID=UPI001CD74B8F
MSIWISWFQYLYCTCPHKLIQSYKNRISGPIYDRNDILLFLQSVNLDQPTKDRVGSTDVRKRVEKAREIQYERYQDQVSNAKVLGGIEIAQVK